MKYKVQFRYENCDGGTFPHRIESEIVNLDKRD